jgi:hypothetical protein
MCPGATCWPDALDESGICGTGVCVLDDCIMALNGIGPSATAQMELHAVDSTRKHTKASFIDSS